jgi:hypothetical protein
VLINDVGVWEFDPTGAKPVRWYRSARKNSIQFRVEIAAARPRRRAAAVDAVALPLAASARSIRPLMCSRTEHRTMAAALPTSGEEDPEKS